MASKNIDLSSYTVQAVSGAFIPNEKDPEKEGSIEVKLRVVEGPHAGEDKFWYGNLNGGAAEITIKILRDMGWSCNDITALTGLGSTKVILRGKSNEYQGKTYQRWDVWPMRTPRPELEATAKANFRDRFLALAASAAPVTVSDGNAAGPLPEAKAKPNGETTRPVDGPAGAVNF